MVKLILPLVMYHIHYGTQVWSTEYEYIIFVDFLNVYTVVGSGIETVCVNSPKVQEQIAVLNKEKNSLQQHKINLEAENARLHQKNLQLECTTH